MAVGLSCVVVQDDLPRGLIGDDETIAPPTLSRDSKPPDLPIGVAVPFFYPGLKPGKLLVDFLGEGGQSSTRGHDHP